MMQRNTDAIPGVPKNLKELLKGDQAGYQIKTVYFLELKHGCWGFFPAIIRKEDRVVVALDPQLLKKVWETLSPRKSKMNSNQFYVNEELMVGFPILGTSDYELESSEPDKILTQEEFDKLMAANPHAFEWAPGLIGNDMSRDEFLRTLEVASEQHSVKLHVQT